MSLHGHNLGRVAVCLAAMLTGCRSDRPTGRVEQFEQSYRRGCAELAMGNADAARPHFQLAAGIRNDHALTHYYLGLCHAMQHQDNQALAGLGRAIRLDPTLAPAFYNLGTLHLRHRRFRQAAEALEQCLELEPDNVPALNNLAKSYYMLNLPELAVNAYLRAAELDPESKVALAGLCRMCLAAGKKDQAMGYLTRLEALDPDTHEVEALKRLVAKKAK